MLCPACKAEMFVLEFERVELDYCPDCGGVWLDSGELELIGARAGALQSDLLAALEAQEGKRPLRAERRRCPICRHVMLHTTTHGENPVVLDRCPAQHGIWFDRGELQAVIRSACREPLGRATGASGDNVLLRFFARLETESDNDQKPGQEGGTGT